MVRPGGRLPAVTAKVMVAATPVLRTAIVAVSSSGAVVCPKGSTHTVGSGAGSSVPLLAAAVHSSRRVGGG